MHGYNLIDKSIRLDSLAPGANNRLLTSNHHQTTAKHLESYILIHA